jgi:hypothetical protein
MLIQRVMIRTHPLLLSMVLRMTQAVQAVPADQTAIIVSIADLNAKSFSAGDNIYLRKGQTWTGVEWAMGDSGEEGSPITIDSFGSGENPIIDGNNTATNCLDLGSTAEWVDIKNIRFTQAVSTNFRMYNCANINADNIVTDNSDQAHGVYFSGQNFVLSNSLIYSNGETDNDHGIYIDSNNETITNYGGTDDVIVEYCGFYDNSGDQIKINSGYQPTLITNVIIRYSYAKAEGAGNSILMGGCSGTKIYYNYFYSKADHDLALIRIGTGDGGGASINTDIWNNVLDHEPATPYYAIRFDSAGNDGMDIRNNLFISREVRLVLSGMKTAGSTMTACDYNHYWGNGGGDNFKYAGTTSTDLTDWQNDTVWGDSSR